MDTMRQSACLVANLKTVDRFGFLFNYTMVGQASDTQLALQSFYLLVGAWCLSLAEPPWINLRFPLALTICESRTPLIASSYCVNCI